MTPDSIHLLPPIVAGVVFTASELILAKRAYRRRKAFHGRLIAFFRTAPDFADIKRFHVDDFERLFHAFLLERFYTAARTALSVVWDRKETFLSAFTHMTGGTRLRLILTTTVTGLFAALSHVGFQYGVAVFAARIQTPLSPWLFHFLLPAAGAALVGVLYLRFKGYAFSVRAVLDQEYWRFAYADFARFDAQNPVLVRALEGRPGVSLQRGIAGVVREYLESAEAAEEAEAEDDAEKIIVGCAGCGQQMRIGRPSPKVSILAVCPRCETRLKAFIGDDGRITVLEAAEEGAGKETPRDSDGASLDWARDILNVPRNAPQELCKQAYRRRIREYHPDRVADLGPEIRELADRKTKQLNTAYRLLVNHRTEQSKAP